MNLTIALDGIDSQIGGTRIDLVASEAVASAREKLRQPRSGEAQPQTANAAGIVAAPASPGTTSGAEQ